MTELAGVVSVVLNAVSFAPVALASGVNKLVVELKNAFVIDAWALPVNGPLNVFVGWAQAPSQTLPVA